ncbi:MAG TPA: hypothetical protein VHM31_09770 [Polyangia bacterium]|nr:hypothetical protein [Polyangia bacterium]
MRRPDEVPERLLAGDATDFERHVLEAARAKGPALESSARMAAALGVRVTTGGPLPSAPAAAAKVAAARTAATFAPAVTPWLPVVAAGLVLAAAAIGVHAWRGAPVKAEGAPATPAIEATPAVPDVQPVTASGAAAPQKPSLSVVGADLHEQIALVDGARTAIAHDDPRRALQVLGRYHDKFPAGSFQPEASALKIEALVRLGRQTEARALANQFVAEYHGSLLAKKVASLAGLSRQTPVR